MLDASIDAKEEYMMQQRFGWLLAACTISDGGWGWWVHADTKKEKEGGGKRNYGCYKSIHRFVLSQHMVQETCTLEKTR
jgi:hypothetical protein